MRALLTPLLLLCATATVGCDELLASLGTDAFVPGPALDAEVAPADVAGRWLLTGEGRLTACEDPAFDTDALRLDGVPLDVAQAGGTLSVPSAPPTPGGQFALREGSVTGNRVRFVTDERLPDGDRIVFIYTGIADSLGRIAGSFEGAGPRGCAAAGDFVVEIR